MGSLLGKLPTQVLVPLALLISGCGAWGPPKHMYEGDELPVEELAALARYGENNLGSLARVWRINDSEIEDIYTGHFYLKPGRHKIGVSSQWDTTTSFTGTAVNVNYKTAEDNITFNFKPGYKYRPRAVITEEDKVILYIEELGPGFNEECFYYFANTPIMNRGYEHLSERC